MAEKIIYTIKPILVEELKKEIENHKTDFDQVEKDIDKVIDGIEGKIKPIAGPIVKGIELIPFGDPKDKLNELVDDIKLKIDGIDLKTELSKIEGLPEDIKSRVAALPEKVKTKLKDSMDKIITGEEKHSDSQGTEVSPSTSTEASESKTEASESKTEASESKSEASESKTEASESASSTSTDLNTQQLFSGLATDKLKDEARKEIIKKLVEDKIFDNNAHIFEFIKIIDKVASPPTTEAEQPADVKDESTASSTEGSLTATAQDNSNTQAENQKVGTEETKTEEVKTGETNDPNILPTPPVAGTDETNTENTNSIMPPAPPSATQATGTEEVKTEEVKTEEAKTEGGAPKKQRRKTKKNIRRGRLNKSTRFGRAF